MEYVRTKYFSDLQNWIATNKTKGYSYRKISNSFKLEKNPKDYLSHVAIQTCLKRSSLSLSWGKGETDGRYPIFSPVDVENLKEYIKEHYISEDFLDIENTVEQSEKFKTLRFINSRQFLIKCNCFEIGIN